MTQRQDEAVPFRLDDSQTAIEKNIFYPIRLRRLVKAQVFAKTAPHGSDGLQIVQIEKQMKRRLGEVL